MGRLLAFDFGGKRTGIAVSDPLKIIATALDTVETEKLFEYIDKYLKNETVDTFVVGYPKDLMNRSQPITEQVDKFILKLQSKYSIPIVKIDERLSSAEAQRTMIMSGMKKSQRQQKGNLDKISAVIILQNYMQRI